MEKQKTQKQRKGYKKSITRARKRWNLLTLVKFAVRHIGFINESENEILTDEFLEKIRDIKETNSEKVFRLYYLPLAINEILKRDNYLVGPNNQQAITLASSKMFKDMSDGVLDEFYRFKEV